jgi:hypothetical protein
MTRRVRVAVRKLDSPRFSLYLITALALLNAALLGVMAMEVAR